MAGGEAWVLILLSGSLLVGYAAHRVFRRYHVSDIALMLGAGVLLGPVTGLVDPGPLRPAFAFLAPIALVIVLFEGGLELAWGDLRKHAGRAVGFALATWILSAGALAAAAWWLLGLTPLLAVLFACAVAATGILAVIPLLQQLEVKGSTKVLLTVETSLGDLLSAVAVTAISGMIVLGAGPWDGAAILGLQFAVGASVGVLAGLVTARGLHTVGADKHGYAVVLACVVLAYVAAESIGGSGFLAALAFGLLLGNARALTTLGGLPALAPPGGHVRLHQSETIFILRSAYFVFLGIALPPGFLTWQYALVGLALTAVLVAARLLAVLLAGGGQDRTLLTAMMPRGLATAVLAGIPFSMGVPGSEPFVGLAFLLIVGADLATSVGLFVHSRQGRSAPIPAPVAPDVLGARE